VTSDENNGTLPDGSRPRASLSTGRCGTRVGHLPEQLSSDSAAFDGRGRFMGDRGESPIRPFNQHESEDHGDSPRTVAHCGVVRRPVRSRAMLSNLGPASFETRGGIRRSVAVCLATMSSPVPADRTPGCTLVAVVVDGRRETSGLSRPPQDSRRSASRGPRCLALLERGSAG